MDTKEALAWLETASQTASQTATARAVLSRPVAEIRADLKSKDSEKQASACEECRKGAIAVLRRLGLFGIRQWNREAWLHAAAPILVSLLRDTAELHGIEIEDRPVPYLSVGFPSGGLRHKRTCECWHCRDEKHPGARAQIFISPVLGDGVQVLDELIHELIHDLVGVGYGHRGNFRKLALAVGLEGKMTATVAGPELKERLERLLGDLGPYPHTKLDVNNMGLKKKKQRCRQRKWVCPECGQIIRAASDDLRIICGNCSRPTHTVPSKSTGEHFVWFVMEAKRGT